MDTTPMNRGFTLLEILIATVILITVTIPVGLLLSSTTGTVRQVDRSREIRMLMRQIVDRIEAMDFVVLWDQFGIQPESPGRITGGRLATPSRNPLFLETSWQNRMDEMGLTRELTFRFMSRSELGVDPANPLKSDSGLLHLQAGIMRLSIEGPGVSETIEKSIYCPMILGRPGLMLNQCPAVNKALRDGKFKNFP